MEFINDKYYLISEIAKILKVSRHTLVHYENEGVITPILRGENGYRYYSCEQLAKFKIVLYLRKLGFSIKEIKNYLLMPNYLLALEQMEEKLKENRLEIEKLLEKEKYILEGISSLKILENIEKNKDSPFLCECNGIKGSILKQNSFELNDTIKNIRKINDVLDDITWTERFSFGFIVDYNKILEKNFYPQYFFVAKEIENFKKYTLKNSLYAILYTDRKETYLESIEKLLNWIEDNSLKIVGELFIEDPSTYTISKKFNPSVKIFKIPVKKT